MVGISAQAATAVPAVDLVGVTDTTGAGDAFAAGFTTSMLRTGLPTPDGTAGTAGKAVRRRWFDACAAGHRAAAALLVARGASRRDGR